MFGLGPTEFIVILLIVLLLFGAKKVPELMRSLGTGLKEFQSGMRSLDAEADGVPGNASAIRNSQSDERS